jgi:hypothetical protein
MCRFLLLCCILLCAYPPNQPQPAAMQSVQVSKDKKGFVLGPSGRPLVPWGSNYDHDDKGGSSKTIGKKSGPRIEATSAK